jgi:Flp pilus assembly protein TadG
MRYGERGQSVVEFVLMLPLILIVTFALAEFGTAFYTFVSINNAASEAARWASLAHVPDSTCASTTKGIEWRAAQMSRGLLDCASADVNFDIKYEDAASGEPARGTGVTVLVTRTYQAVTPFPSLANFFTGGALPASWAMTACSDARLEQRMPSGTYTAGTGDCGD